MIRIDKDFAVHNYHNNYQKEIEKLCLITHDPKIFRFHNPLKPVLQIHKCFLEQGGGFWVVDHTPSRRLVGMLGLQKRSNQVMQLKALRIHPEFRRLGLAQHLLGVAETFTKDHLFMAIYLEVSCLNLAGIQLYVKYGFQQVGVRKTKPFDNLCYKKSVLESYPKRCN